MTTRGNIIWGLRPPSLSITIFFTNTFQRNRFRCIQEMDIDNRMMGNRDGLKVFEVAPSLHMVELRKQRQYTRVSQGI
ncbi:unnamed protein product [Lupinus luteus]|uniref:Uncharacterized protein n=1 Tax=Lupinus luteus TaxID=3873 RepID=A0AAV1XX00_LUPLU